MQINQTSTVQALTLATAISLLSLTANEALNNTTAGENSRAY